MLSIKAKVLKEAVVILIIDMADATDGAFFFVVDFLEGDVGCV